MIVNNLDEIVYCPPDFIRHKVNKNNLSKVCDVFNNKYYDIQEITNFESSLRPI